jgi:hypothetical protein
MYLEDSFWFLIIVWPTCQKHSRRHRHHHHKNLVTGRANYALLLILQQNFFTSVEKFDFVRVTSFEVTVFETHCLFLMLEK